MTETVLEIRQALIDHGFTPIPVIGKVPPFERWQKVENVSRAMLEAWGRNFPRASNTGILTRFTPTIDIDVLNEPAAIAAEELARERFEERGYFLVRIGRSPKRAIPFRTLQPFAKLTTNFVVPASASAEKIEFLCDGQQFVAHGVHPDTLKPYNWFGGDPTTISYDDLPYISAEEAQQLQNDVAALLVRDFGYVIAPGRPTRKGNGTPEDHVGDWQSLVDSILTGADLHASTRDLAAKMARSGMDGGAIVNFLRGLMNSSAAPRDERWQDRYDNLPRQVDTIQAKIERESAAAAAAIVPAPIQPGTSSPPPSPPPPPSSPSAQSASQPGPQPRTSPIEDTLKVFREWLQLDNDIPVLAVLGTIAANMLPGDPVWLGLVAPPSSAKTEILSTLAKVPNAELVGTLSPAGLLSGTPRRQQAVGARGGLLQKIGAFGFIVLTEFSTILSLRPDTKAEVFAALRGIYDGKWSRAVGADGGRTLHWEGKIGLLFACTKAIDKHYGFIQELGNRFLYCRLAPDPNQFLHATKHIGVKTTQMRRQLIEAVANLFATPLPAPHQLTNAERDKINKDLKLLVRLRGGVDRDYRTRELEDVQGAEGTGRLGLTLERLLAGLDSLGIERATALKVVRTVAFDSVPPNRLLIYRHLKKINPAWADTSTIAKAIQLPTITVRRVLEELVAYSLAEKGSAGQGHPTLWRAL